MAITAADAPCPARSLAAWRARGGVLLCAVLASPALAQTAGTDAGLAGDTGTLLPRVGSTVPATLSGGSGSDGFVQGLADAMAGVLPASPQFSLTPSLGVEQEYDAISPGQSFLVTNLEPAITVQRNGERLEADLTYAPVIRLYEDGDRANGTSGINVAQDFNGHALVTLLPQTAFLDVRGYGAEQPRFGGTASTIATTLPADGLTQNYSISVFPYLLHRFGEVGTAEVGYDFQRTWQHSPGLDETPNLQEDDVQALESIGNQDVTTTTAHAAFTTGEAFGRYNGAALVSDTDYDGQDVLRGAHRVIASLDSGYAVTRTLTALVRVGYENIAYAGTNPVRIDDAIWDVGVRASPAEAVSVTVRYGHHDGFDSLTADAHVALSARSSVFGSYSAGLSTPIVDLQNALADSDLDTLGEPVDHGTGTPIYVTDDFAGTDAALYRLRRLSAGGQWIRDRNAVSVSINREARDLVSAPFEGAEQEGVAGSYTDTDGTISYARDLTPEISGIASFEYGVSSGLAGTGHDGSSYTASLSGRWEISDTLSATALYSRSVNDEPALFVEERTTQDRFLLGLRKSF